MRLDEIPVEMLYCIADEFEYTWTVRSLALVNSHLYESLDPYLYRFNKQYSPAEAFLFAIKHGLSSLVRKLLDLQSNDLDEDTWKKLMTAAAKRGNLEILTLVLDVGKQLHASSGWSDPFPRYLDGAFWHAMNCHHGPVIQLLLEHGAAPVLRNKQELVHYRGIWKKVRVAKLLIRCAHQSTVPGSVSLSHLLQYAIRDFRGCKPEIVQYLLDHEADRTVLFGSASEVHGLGYCNNPETVRCLLEYGVGSGLLGEALIRSLQTAISSHKFNTARVLLEYVDITPALEDRVAGLNLLRMAAEAGSESMVCRLIQSGLSIEGLSRGTDPRDLPLVCAVRNGQEDMVSLLLRHGANPHPKALTAALKHSSMTMTRMLLDAGADPNRRNSYGRSRVLKAAVGDEDLFRLLLERGAAIPSGLDLMITLRETIHSGRVPELQMMLDKGVSLPNHKFNLLETATEGGREMLEFLYNDGVLLREINKQKKDDTDDLLMMYLITCLFNGGADSFMWLLDKGLITTPFSARYPCHILDCLFRHSPSDQETERFLDMLERYGIKLNITPQCNRLAVSIMLTLRSQVALKAFLDRGAKLLPEHVDKPKFLRTHANSRIRFEMMLNAVLRDSPREETRRLLLELKEYAAGARRWPAVRFLEYFQYTNGLY